MSIKINDLTVTFKNKVTAINHADLEIHGGIFGLLGDCGIIGLNRKNLTNTGVLRHSPISLTRKGWLKHCHTDLIKQRCN